jgi:hypothetical protein
MMVSLPAARPDVVRSACPLLFSATGPVRLTTGVVHVPPSMNVILPLVTAVVVPCRTTLAVKVTELP